MKLNITKVSIECTYADKEAKFEFDDVEQAELIINNRGHIDQIHAQEGEGEATFIISKPVKTIFDHKHNGEIKTKDTWAVGDPEGKNKEEQAGEVQEAIIEKP